MTAAAHASENPGLGGPAAIRAALPAEDVGDFDREYRQAMADATETLDLTGVAALLRRWQRVAQLARDSEAYRRMLDHADRLNAGEDISTQSWADTKAVLGL